MSNVCDWFLKPQPLYDWLIFNAPQPKKFLAVEPSMSPQPKKNFGCGAFNVATAKKKFWLWSLQCLLILAVDI